MKKILVELNQTCNLNCEYCFYKDYGRKKSHLNLNKLIKLGIEKYDVIYLTGGEPFLNQDIYNILKYLYQKQKKIIVFTNGTLLLKKSEKEIEEILKYLDKIIITLDSLESTYTLRELSEQENIKKIIDIILKICKEKLEIKIGVNKLNILTLEETINYLTKKGVKNLSFNLIHNIKTCEKNIQLKEEKEYNYFLFIMNKYIKFFNEKSVIAFNKYLKSDFDFHIKTCICGEKFEFMDCDGNFYFCPANLKNNIKKINCFSEECINLWEMF